MNKVHFGLIILNSPSIPTPKFQLYTQGNRQVPGMAQGSASYIYCTVLLPVMMIY